MKANDVLIIDKGPCKGATCVVLRRSKRTGGLTVKLLSNHIGGYKAGDTVHVAAYECRLMPPEVRQ